MEKKFQNKLSCIKTLVKLSKKRRSFAMLAVRSICGKMETSKLSVIK